MQVVVLAVVCCCDFGQQARHHFDNVGDGHLTDLVLRADICRVSSVPPRQRPRLGEGTRVV